MSFFKSGRDVGQDNSQFIEDYPRKGYNKIDPLEKLQIINALDNGQCKADVAKKFGVHIQTISYIYKQKESILRKYTQKYNILEKHARCANLDHVLVEWLRHEIKNGNVVTEDHLRDKAHECVRTMRDDCPSICTDDWLLDFRIRNNIAKYASDIECNSHDKDEWLMFLQDSDVNDVYFGMTCALNYNFDFNKYVNDINANNYISVLMVTNGLGTDKRELAVVGKDLLTDMHLGSLPVNYYYSDSPQINFALMFNYLKKWDIELKIKNSKASLLLDLPDKSLELFQLENIKLINASKLNYTLKIIEKIVQSFKYHYRKLQITRTVMLNKDTEQSDSLGYIYMINSAWYNVSSRYIKHLALPLSEGSLYFKGNDAVDLDHSLSNWCKVHNIKLNPSVSPQTLDKFISCDNKIQSTNLIQSQDTQLYTRELTFERNIQPTSGVDAYQAIKRLVSYLQGEGADKSVMQHARLLEDHLEYGALVEIHQIINSTND